MAHHPVSFSPRRMIFVSLFFCFLFGFSLIAGEFAVRLFSKTGYITPEILRNMSFQYDSSVFAQSVFPRREQRVKGMNGVDVFINSKGYRGKDFSLEKPQGTVRIIVYGGSAAFDLAAPEGKDWPHQVETRFRSLSDQTIEVINAGVPSHASYDSVGRLFAEGHIFSPDYVILYNAWNDIKRFGEAESLLRTVSPYVPRDDPYLFYQNGLDTFLSETSQLYVRLRTRYYNFRIRRTDEGREPEGELSDILSPAALEQFRISVATFVDVARTVHAQPILMTQARLISDASSSDHENRMKYHLVQLTHPALLQAFLQTDAILFDVARTKHVALIDSSSQMSGKEEYFLDQVHLSAQGGAELSSLVASDLQKILVSDRTIPSSRY